MSHQIVLTPEVMEVMEKLNRGENVTITLTASDVEFKKDNCEFKPMRGFLRLRMLNKLELVYDINIEEVEVDACVRFDTQEQGQWALNHIEKTLRLLNYVAQNGGPGDYRVFLNSKNEPETIDLYPDLGTVTMAEKCADKMVADIKAGRFTL